MDLKGNLLIYDSSYHILYYLVFTTLHMSRQYIHANEYNILFFRQPRSENIILFYCLFTNV